MDNVTFMFRYLYNIYVYTILVLEFKTNIMKKVKVQLGKMAFDYDLAAGTHSLKYYKFWTPGLRPYKSKEKIVEALNLGLLVFCKDKIMGTTTQWHPTLGRWE